MGYRSAGTVEFIVDVDTGDYYFMVRLGASLNHLCKVGRRENTCAKWSDGNAELCSML